VRPKDKITVVWLDNGEVTSDFATSICDIFREHANVITGRVVVRSGGAITRGRNSAINEFLAQSKDEWALLVDSDMKFTPNDLRVVMTAADRKSRPVVGGLCFAHSGQNIGAFPMLMPTIYHRSATREQSFTPMFDYPTDTLVECDATGAAFLLVHRDVLEGVRELVQLGGWSWFHEGPTDDLASWMGEDVSFCNLIKAAGFPIHVHTGARIGHVKGVNYTLDEDMYQMMYQGATQVAAANADA